jgi:cysteine desulfurase
MTRFIYADNAATTAVSKEVLDAMIPYFCEKYGNPSSIYSIGREAYSAVDDARQKTAKALGCNPEEIYFTSGGSEADNWAIRGTALANKKKGKHIISAVFEHHAVLHTLNALEKDGYEVTYLKINSNGIVKPEDLEAAIRPDTILVTIMYANNEIGTIQPIKQLAKICRDKGIFFHTDAVQAIGHIEINVKEQLIDMLSLSAHKFNGPKGVGALYIRKEIRLPNLIEGGAQEKGKRAGTENVAGIVGLGKAIEIASANIDEKNEKAKKLRDKLIQNVIKMPMVRINGDMNSRLAGNANFSIEGIEGESLLLMLDLKGICASSGSACTSGSLDPSHVLLALGLRHEVAHGSLRFSFSENNTEEEIDYILEVLPVIVERLRSMSPVWEKMQNDN